MGTRVEMREVQGQVNTVMKSLIQTPVILDNGKAITLYTHADKSKDRSDNELDSKYINSFQSNYSSPTNILGYTFRTCIKQSDQANKFDIKIYSLVHFYRPIILNKKQSGINYKIVDLASVNKDLNRQLQNTFKAYLMKVGLIPNDVMQFEYENVSQKRVEILNFGSQANDFNWLTSPHKLSNIQYIILDPLFAKMFNLIDDQTLLGMMKLNQVKYDVQVVQKFLTSAFRQIPQDSITDYLNKEFPLFYNFGICPAQTLFPGASFQPEKAFQDTKDYASQIFRYNLMNKVIINKNIPLDKEKTSKGAYHTLQKISPVSYIHSNFSLRSGIYKFDDEVLMQWLEEIKIKDDKERLAKMREAQNIKSECEEVLDDFLRDMRDKFKQNKQVISDALIDLLSAYRPEQKKEIYQDLQEEGQRRYGRYLGIEGTGDKK